MKYAAVAIIALIIVSSMGGILYYEINKGCDPAIAESVSESFRDSLEVAGYETFSGRIETDDGDIHGLGFCNYSKYLEDDEGGNYVCAGFIPTGGGNNCRNLLSSVIIKEYDNTGLVHLFTDVHDPVEYQYVYNGTYVRYGVDDDGCFFIDSHNLIKWLPIWDYTSQIQHYGSVKSPLYNYDTGTYNVYPEGKAPSFYMAVSFQENDYRSIEAELNSLVQEQTKNLLSVSISTYTSYVKQAYEAYLDSIIGGSIFGYTAEELRNVSANLSDNEFLKLTKEGASVITITQPTIDEVGRWISGIVCAALVVSSCFLPVNALLVPLITAMASTMINTTMTMALTGSMPDPASVLIDCAVCLASAIPGVGVAASCLMQSIGAAAYSIIEGKSAEEAIMSAGIAMVVGTVMKSSMSIVTSKMSSMSGKIQSMARSVGDTLEKQGIRLVYNTNICMSYTVSTRLMERLSDISESLINGAIIEGQLVVPAFSFSEKTIKIRDSVPGLSNSDCATIEYYPGVSDRACLRSVTVSSTAESPVSFNLNYAQSGYDMDTISMIVESDGHYRIWSVEEKTLDQEVYIVSYYEGRGSNPGAVIEDDGSPMLDFSEYSLKWTDEARLKIGPNGQSEWVRCRPAKKGRKSKGRLIDYDENLSRDFSMLMLNVCAIDGCISRDERQWLQAVLRMRIIRPGFPGRLPTNAITPNAPI